MYLHYVGNTIIDTMVSIEDIESVVRNLKKRGKAAGADNIVAEHIVHLLPYCTLETFIPYDAFACLCTYLFWHRHYCPTCKG